MTIIEILAREDGSHNIQSRHGAARVWEDGYIEVPSHLEAAVWATCGWCDLHIEEGRLVGVTPTERPPEPEPEPEPPSVEERVAALEMKPLSRSLRARPNRNLSTHSRTMRCWIYMKCWEVKSNGSKSNRTQLLAQYQTGGTDL